MNNEQRKAYNQERIKLLALLLRPNVAAIIADLEAAGWQPIIDQGVYRTPAEQAQKVAQGVSTVYYSYHNVTDPGGVPASHAADIVDVRYQWDAPRKYWLQLAAAAENQGLETGIYWGLSIYARSEIHKAISLHDWDASIQLGWDTAHVQPPQSKFTISQAKSGHRYNPGAVKKGLFDTVEEKPVSYYSLLASDGHAMDTLSVYDGTAYVSARKWGDWIGLQVGFDGHANKVILAGNWMPTKIINGIGYIPIREAAEAAGLNLIVDNNQKTIILKRN